MQSFPLICATKSTKETTGKHKKPISEITKKHKKLIIENLTHFADDVGESLQKVIADFNCLKNSGITDDDVITALMYPRSCEEYTVTQVYNALAQYAGETVAQEYVVFVYNLENGD